MKNLLVQRLIAGVFALGMFYPIVGEAGEAEIPLAAPTVIADESGLARILIRPTSLAGLDGKFVVSAYLEFTLPGNTPVRNLDIEAYALSTDWDRSFVTWMTPWNTGGGDIDEEFFSTLRLEQSRAATKMRLEVSPMVRAMVDGDKGAYGFVISIPWRRGDGFRVEDLNVLGGLTSGTLRVDYRNTNRVPRS